MDAVLTEAQMHWLPVGNRLHNKREPDFIVYKILEPVQCDLMLQRGLAVYNLCQ